MTVGKTTATLINLNVTLTTPLSKHNRGVPVFVSYGRGLTLTPTEPIGYYTLNPIRK